MRFRFFSKRDSWKPPTYQTKLTSFEKTCHILRRSLTFKTSKFGIKFGFWKVLKIYWYFLCGQICSECPYCRLRRIFSAVRILPLYLIVVHVRANLKICQTTCFFVIVYLKPKRVRKKSGRKHMDRAWSIYCYIKYGVVFVQFHWLNQSRDIQNI